MSRRVREVRNPFVTPLSRRVWSVSLPVLFAGVSESVVHTVQTAFLARVGTTELVTIALADTLLYVWLVPIMGLVQGMQITVARRHAQDRQDAVRVTLANSLVLVLLLGDLLALGLWALAPLLARMLSDSPGVSAALRTYLNVAAPGVVFYAGTLAYAAFFTGIAKTRPLIKATLVLVVADVVLGYALILGHLGFSPLGIKGAGLAFVGGECAMFFYLTWRLLQSPNIGGIAALRPRMSDKQFSLRRLVGISTPVSLQALLNGLSWLVVFFVLGWVSDEAVAVTNIAYACFTVLVIPAYAFADVASSLVSSLIGRGRDAMMASLLRSVARATYAISLPFVLFTLLAPNIVLTIFTSDPEVVGTATPSLRVAAVAIVVAVPAEIWISAVAGTGSTDTAFWFEVMLTAVFVTGSVVSTVVLNLPLVWVWVSLLTGWLLSFGLSARWLRAGRWQRKAV